MTVISKNFGFTGQVGVTPRRVQLVVTDSEATLVTANFLQQDNLNPDVVYPTDIFDVIFSYNSVTRTGTYGVFTPSITAGVITLVPYVVNGNFVSAVTGTYAGGGTSNAFTATGLTTSSIVVATIKTSTNSVAITKAVPTANTLTITFSADPGAGTTVNYIAINPSV